MFKGSDNDDQLVKIAQFMGTEDLQDYVKNYKLSIKSFVAKRLKNWEKQPWDKLIHKGNKHLVTDEALDLLDKMLVYDREKRISPQEAMKHDYFKPVLEYKAQLNKEMSDD